MTCECGGAAKVDDVGIIEALKEIFGKQDISACMSDPTKVDHFPDEKQRAAVCYSMAEKALAEQGVTYTTLATVFVTSPAQDGHVHYVGLGEYETDEALGHRHTLQRGAAQTDEANGHWHLLPETFVQANKNDPEMPDHCAPDDPECKDRWVSYGKIEKLDEEQRVAYGWFSVIEENGQPVVDSQGDVIKEQTLVDAIRGFVSSARSGKVMHKGEPVAEVVEAIVLTKDLQAALGIDLGKVGAFGAMKFNDEAAWADVKSGKFAAFSIGGRGLRESME